jgi:Ca2+-binding EF-hand superfamily protein
MKTITMLSVAIATSLATHLAFAMPVAGDVPPSDCMAGVPAPDGMMPGGKGHGKKDKAAKRQAKVAEILAKFDANQDGQITQDEAQAKRDEVHAKRVEKFQKHAEKVLEKFDLNQDGQITLDEVQALHTERFTEIDADGNGFLSVEEFQKGAPRPPKEGAPDDMDGPPPMGPEGGPDDMAGPRKGPTGNHRPGAGKGGCLPPIEGAGKEGEGKGGKEQRRQEHFNSLDSDGDGQISKTEFMADLPLFDKFDCDNNGVITQDDLAQGPCQVPVEGDSTGETSPPATPPLPVFDKFDCNQDGVVTTAELQQGACQTAQPSAVEEPVSEEPVEEMPTSEDTTVTPPTVSSGHGGGAPCSTCHSN